MARLASSVISARATSQTEAAVTGAPGIAMAGMMSGLYAAKLSIPHQGRVLARARLLASARTLAAGGVLSVVAGPGYGKTAFLADLADRWEGPVVYYCLDRDDQDPAQFLGCLVEGVERACPGLGESARERLAECADPAREALHVVATLLADMNGGPRPGLLVFDDVHAVGDSESVTAALQFLTDGLPPAWTVGLASRRRPALDLDPLRAQGRLRDIGLRQLRLTPTEVREWVLELWGATVSLPDARALWRLTEGWPAAFMLLGRHHDWRDRPPGRDQLLRWARHGRHFNDYLAATVFKTLDPEVADLLVCCAPLPRVSFPRDAPLFAAGGPFRGGAERAEELLDELVATGFFVVQSGFRTYTLHRLLRSFAEREARRRDPDQVKRLVSRAARHLEAVGDARGAVALYLESGQPAAAAGPLRTLASQDLNAAAAFARPEWLDLISGEVVAQEPWLLLLRARVLQRRSDFSAAESAYAAAARVFERTSDRLGLFQARMGQAFCLYMSGRWEDSATVLQQVERWAVSPAERAEVRATRGNVLLSLCRWDEAVEHFEAALATVTGEERRALELRICSNRSRLFYMRGNYARSADWARKAVRLASSQRRVSYAMTLNTAATVLYQIGRYAEAAMHAEAAAGLVRARGYAFLEGPVLLARAGVDLGAGSIRSAVTRVKRALQLARDTGDAEVEVWALDMLGGICRRNRNPKRALKHHQAALERVERSQLGAYEHVRILCGLGMDLTVSGENAEAEGMLEQAARLSRQWGFDALLCEALFYLGWLYAQRGAERAASRALGEAMRLAEENEYVHFLLQEAAAAVPVLALCERFGCGELVRERIAPRLPPKLREYLGELMYGPAYPTDVALGAPVRSRLRGRAVSSAAAEDSLRGVAGSKVENLTERETEILRMIALGMPNKVIAAKLFIAERTVKTHANRIYRKLGVNNRLQAVLALQEYERMQKARGRIETP